MLQKYTFGLQRAQDGKKSELRFDASGWQQYLLTRVAK